MTYSQRFSVFLHTFLLYEREKTKFQNVNTSENNIISVEDIKVVGVKGSI
jgi:hypothetical protein